MTTTTTTTCNSCGRDLDEVKPYQRLTVADGLGSEAHACSPDCLRQFAIGYERDAEFNAALQRLREPAPRRAWWRFKRGAGA